MGMARALSSNERIERILLRCQHDMFTVATEVATPPEHYDLLVERFSPVTARMVERLEGWIDAIRAEIDLPPRFIVPGASPASGAIDLARSLTRDAERRIVALCEREPPRNPNVLRYVNRPLRPPLHPRPAGGQGSSVRGYHRRHTQGRGIDGSRIRFFPLLTQVASSPAVIPAPAYAAYSREYPCRATHAGLGVRCR